MSKKGQKALDRKMEMQDRIKEMEEKIKEYEQEAEQQLGKHVLKEWEIKSDVDSESIYEVITLLKNEAKQLIEQKKDEVKDVEDENKNDSSKTKGLGKSEEQETQTTP